MKKPGVQGNLTISVEELRVNTIYSTGVSKNGYEKRET